jgi:hypothetical protein
VEEVCCSDSNHVRKGKENLYKVFGRTASGRFLLVVLVNMGGGDWKVATARGMTDKEKRLYKSVTGGK